MAARVRIHLPNVVFTMLHAPDLPAHQVAFKVPQHINKLDIHQYLSKIYQLEVAEVRTMNYLGHKSKQAGGLREIRVPKYKKAIVTLANGNSFTWPAAPSDQELAAIRRPEPRSVGEFGKNSMRKMFKNAAKPTDEGAKDKGAAAEGEKGSSSSDEAKS
ncbi:hypothetical protein BCR44DRAFT_44559 [Catenaria anguillulae PL171]|uniref:Large ribosomal subunit protein uL23m n=1 Tax=Catenaria anguillulae PL171 TaxID=765915 RepID=A0A1Y2I091_9FUNG|nr:hypothetical protein BCR44DRAFT_44559 [Catenaria anguillulae PL171]